jgi:hypothetical protein
MNENKYQNMKEASGLLGSLSCGLILIFPMIVILFCLLILVGAVITGGH